MVVSVDGEVQTGGDVNPWVLVRASTSPNTWRGICAALEEECHDDARLMHRLHQAASMRASRVGRAEQRPEKGAPK